MKLTPNIRLAFVISAIILILCVVIFLQGGQNGAHERESFVASSRAANTLASTTQQSTASSIDSVDWKAKIAEAKRGEYAGLMRSAFQISDPQLRQEIVAALSLKWMNDDLVSFISFLDEIDAREITDRQSWAILAPALMEALPQVGNLTALSSYLTEVVQRLILFQATQDPIGMLKWAQDWLDGDSLQFALATLAPYLFKTNPTQAWGAFAQINSPLYRTQAIEQLAAAWTASEPDKAIAWVRQLPTRNERARGMNSALKTLAQSQPDEAAEQLSSFSRSTQSEYQATVQAELAANGISPTDPAANPYTEEGREGAAAAPPNSPDLEALQGAAAAIGSKLAASDPQAAVAWANSISNPILKAQILQSSLVSWSKQDPGAAAEYYLNSGLDGAVASSIFKSWAAQDPTTAANRASTVSNSATRQQAITGAVSGWTAKANTTSAAQWIDTLSNVTDRDIANASLVNSLIATKPTDAFTRALQITNDSLRTKALTSSYTRLAATKPTAAQNLLDRSNLSTSDLATLQKINRAINTAAR